VISVGLPYFALSSTGPLVQVWFSRASRGGAPWRLYALSNLGSLAALISYPFFFEVRWDVLEQTTLWSLAFGVFALLSLFLVWRDRKLAPEHVEPEDVLAESPPEGHAPTWWRRILWLMLPALASVLLLATTNHVCQDVAVVPFLWVIPLSLYLLTFIICFEHERWYQPVLWSVVAIPAILMAAGYLELDWDWENTFALPFGGKEVELPWEWDLTYKIELVICFGAMFFGCMVCHGELVRLKPDPKHLTEFYLWMSAGGALGGLLVSLVAPRVFTTYLEWPIALMGAFVVAMIPVIRFTLRKSPRNWRELLALPVVIVTVAVLYFMQEWGFYLSERLVRVRNFYGAISVEEDSEEDYGSWRYLHHGGIIHGLQNFGEGDREEPFSYYAHESGIGRALDSLANRPEAKVGIVGMGTATVAAYGKPGHTFRFYEINPAIVDIAWNYFTFMEDLETRGGTVEVVVGDARLSMEREESQQFDVLLLDAFSGDSVPVHLLTREAFEIYQRHMKPDGIIVVHCTNRYLALASPVKKLVEEMGYGTTRIGTDEDGDYDITDYLLVTRNQTFLDANPEESPFEEILLDVDPWTDTRHNLFEILEKD
jgi:spermidine synthase